MLFSSLEFAVFLPLVFALYWAIPNIRIQNILLIVASYVFYGWWDWRFLSLIAFSSLVDFIIGRKLSSITEKKPRRMLLTLSIAVNLGLLGFFKYYNFFAESFRDAFTLFGTSFEINRLNIILPVGISFYTFQTMSYTLDVYRGKLKATNNIDAFFAFVSFFPQLVAGPIERASNLLPQFFKQRKFSYDDGIQGLSQIGWGLFKKVVIADSCAVIVNQIFVDYSSYSGSTLLLGAVLFAFQIYGDFSGYSDIAIGTARLFGFDLKENFKLPYFSRDISEFWRRWHISLSTWFRDYLYIPLGGSRKSLKINIRNIFIIFLVSGLWHGANWTFVVWGAYNALLFLPLFIGKRNRKYLDNVAENRFLPTFRECLSMTTTFGLVVLGWIFFRSDNINNALDYFSIIFSKSLASMPFVFGVGREKFFITILFVGSMILIEWIRRKQEVPIYFGKNKNLLNWTLLMVFGIIIFLFGENQQDFIYFQF